jgi:integrase
MHKLKAITLRNLKPGHHGDGGGLYLAVSKSGKGRSWVFRSRRGGQLREIGLGGLDTISLEKARRKAAALREQFLEGRDPLEEKRQAERAARVAEAKATTFEQAAQAYIRAHRSGWKSPKSLAAWEHTLQDFAHPVLGKLPVQEIDTTLVLKVLEPLWNSRPETANRLRGRLEMVLDYARVIGQRQGENPARWKGHLDHLLPARSKVAKVEHHAALPYRELPGFLRELHQREGVAARALEFAILTAARTGEVIGARWDEIDLTAKLWTIPGERMKAGREHRVPLSEAALEILRPLYERRTGDRVFPLSNMAMAMLLRRMGRVETVHGFRSTFSDWCSEMTNFPSEVREMALAHVVGDKVEAAYRRGDLFEKRRQLAEAWARFCQGETEENVIQLRA